MQDSVIGMLHVVVYSMGGQNACTHACIQRTTPVDEERSLLRLAVADPAVGGVMTI